jgi:hypothetical protein
MSGVTDVNICAGFWTPESGDAPTGRTYDRSRPTRSNRQKPIAKRPSTYGGFPPCIYHNPLRGNGSVRKPLVFSLEILTMGLIHGFICCSA